MQAGTVIGYYVHHQGSGHAHRALAITEALALPVTGLSTAISPHGWPGDWVQLADDAEAQVTPPAQGWTNGAAGSRLHYAPLHHPGLRTRMAQVADWIERMRPALMVVDVSVEVALLARLHGVPVVVVAMPGHRGDAAHRLGYDVAEAILAPWPEQLGALWHGPPNDLAKTTFVGAVARYAPEPAPSEPTRNRVVVLNGTGGSGPCPEDIAAARAATPGWEWVHLDRQHGTWLADPWPMIRSAAVVVSHAGQNAVAEIAAARRPALLIPQDRPFDEQRVLAAALADQTWCPAEVRLSWPAGEEWPALLARVRGLDGTGWVGWNDGQGAARAAERLLELAEGAGHPPGRVSIRRPARVRPAQAVRT